MWMVLMCFISVSTTRGFLLEPDHTGNPAGKIQCLPIGTYLSDKEDLRHQMDKLQRENEQKLGILTSQLQSRLSAFEGKMSENDRKNETLELEILEKKYQELGFNFTLLQQENKLLRDRFGYQESETKRLQNTTIELSKKVSDLEQLKSINQALDIRAIQTKVHSLEQETSLLTSNQNARNQDFLALYNVTQVTDKNLNELHHQYKNELQSFETSQNETLVKLFEDVLHNVTSSLQNIKSSQNITSFEVQSAVSKIKTLESELANDSKKVAVTACVSSSKTFSGGVVKFANVHSNVGFKDIATFKSSGKFVCEFPGLYYISSHLRTTNQNNAFYVKKNSEYIAYSATDDENHWSTNPISAVVELQLKDTLYVYAPSINIDSSYSCLSIVKIK